MAQECQWQMQRSRSFQELQEAADPASLEYLRHVWNKHWEGWAIECICKSNKNKPLQFWDVADLKKHMEEKKHTDMIEKARQQPDWYRKVAESGRRPSAAAS